MCISFYPEKAKILISQTGINYLFKTICIPIWLCAYIHIYEIDSFACLMPKLVQHSNHCKAYRMLCASEFIIAEPRFLDFEM